MPDCLQKLANAVRLLDVLDEPVQLAAAINDYKWGLKIAHIDDILYLKQIDK